MSSSLTTQFEEAKNRLTALKENPGNATKLKLYGLFKQATIGPCNTSQPKAFDFVGKAKWDAWKSLGTITQDEAKAQYISLVNELVKSDGAVEPEVLEPSTNSEYEGLIYEEEKNFTRISFNRPNKKNAITLQMYKDLVSVLKRAAENDTAFTVITGKGDYFCSGNDLTNFSSVVQGDLAKGTKDAGNMLKEFVSAFIDFPKPLIAAVNGPAIGISVTILGLFDISYASDTATFQTPFSLLGQSPEACATYTFPKIMGYAKANEMLMFSKKLTAAEAKEVGLICEVFPQENFEEEMEKVLSSFSKCSKQSIKYAKQLLRDPERDALHKANAAESERLVERWQSPECMAAITNFFQRK